MPTGFTKGVPTQNTESKYITAKIKQNQNISSEGFLHSYLSYQEADCHYDRATQSYYLHADSVV